MPWRARDFVHFTLRWWAGRPQLKRDPLGGNPPTLMARAFLFVALMLATDCSRRQRAPTEMPITVTSVIGCYQFTWDRGDSALTGSSIPDFVHLDSTPACPTCQRDAPAAAYLSLGSPLPDTASNVPGQTIPWHRYYYASHWLIEPPDTVTILFNSNYTHWDVRLVSRQGAVLAGVARYWADGGVFDSGPVNVVARRRACVS